ncbi:mariner Mos1 transposase [Trichonephila clavipes]|nr:mariner Mos1 transposase [Trichonephila clavipes]
MRKIAAHGVLHQLTEVQKWHRYALAGIQQERYHNEGDAFQQRNVPMVKRGHEGVILRHAVLARQDANADYYCRFLQHPVRLPMRRKRPRLLQNNLLIVLLDNARCHVANNVTLLKRRWQREILEHPPYSPGMSPCDFYLFPKLKEPLRGHRFHDISSVHHAVGHSVTDINNQHLIHGYQRLPDIW